MRDYWTTDPVASTPTFANLMSGARYMHIWQYWARTCLLIREWFCGEAPAQKMLVGMVCQDDKGYIHNMEIYTGNGKELEDTIPSVLTCNLGLWHHIYQDNY
jgi:hypothetical protein